MDKVVTALDYARRKGYKDLRSYIQGECDERTRSGKMDSAFDVKTICGKKVFAELNHGQWIARCECGGAEAVDPSDPIFFCFSCGNFRNKGKLRPVVFPNNLKDIEKEVMKRPIEIKAGIHEIERLTLAKPVKHVNGKGFLSRTWLPSESVEDIIAQNKVGGIK